MDCNIISECTTTSHANAANEIGGVMSSDDRRREYATASRSWILPGVVNHGQKMVMSGIFPLDDNECDEEDASMDDAVDISLQGKKMEAIKSEPKQQPSSLAQVLTLLQKLSSLPTLPKLRNKLLKAKLPKRVTMPW